VATVRNNSFIDTLPDRLSDLQKKTIEEKLSYMQRAWSNVNIWRRRSLSGSVSSQPTARLLASGFEPATSLRHFTGIFIRRGSQCVTLLRSPCRWALREHVFRVAPSLATLSNNDHAAGTSPASVYTVTRQLRLFVCRHCTMYSYCGPIYVHVPHGCRLQLSLLL